MYNYKSVFETEKWCARKLNFMPNLFPGKLICFEGIDGSGKTTLLKAVQEELEKRGIVCYATKSPTDIMRETYYWKSFSESKSDERENIDPFGISILALGDRIIHQGNKIIPELQKGNYVLTDRYYLNQILYQACNEFVSFSKYILKPNLGVIVDAEPELSTKRIAEREEFERKDDQRAKWELRERYLELGRLNDYIVVSSSKMSVKEEVDVIMEEIL